MVDPRRILAARRRFAGRNVAYAGKADAVESTSFRLRKPLGPLQFRVGGARLVVAPEQPRSAARVATPTGDVPFRLVPDPKLTLHIVQLLTATLA